MSANAPPRTTIVLLAGGLATRLPGKLRLPIGGEPMLARVYRRLNDGRRPCVVSARAPLEPPLARKIGAPVVLDEYRDCGPLGGLVTAAGRVATPLVFAAAGDLPGLDARFIDDLEAEFDAARPDEAPPPEAVVPVWPDGKLEPLAALYDAAALARAGRYVLDAGMRRVTAVLEHMRVVAFAVRPQDEARLANVNTRDDYDAYDA